MGTRLNNPCSMAITYVAKEYDTKREHLMGRHSASEAFLKSWVQSEVSSPLFSYSLRSEDHRHFQEKVSQWQTQKNPCIGVRNSRELVHHQCDALYTPDPNLARGAWHRTAIGSSAYSILGVTHTLSSDGAMDLIGELTTAPVEPWDALICTSESVKKVVEKLLERKIQYFQHRFRLNSRPTISLPQLPIIPLGVDIERYPEPEDSLDLRKSWRQKLNIPQDSFVSLFMGRLSFHAKAHPFPMFESLERCAKQSHIPMTLILCGWFANEATKGCFIEAAEKLCPSVKLVIVDGRDYETQNTIWSAADVFISLSDNIQETFGLTPLEAMANGLPVVVSDWDGYRESVRHGVDGFRSKTISPPPGSGEGLARLHDEGSLNYDAFLLESCHHVVVDVEEVTEHIQRLIDHPQLRKEMGKNGRRRVKEYYTWNSIAEQYRELLSHLKERRVKDSKNPPKPLPHPLRPDPFLLHSHYATTLLKSETLLRLGKTIPKAETTLSLKAGKPLRPLNPELTQKILDLVSESPLLPLAELQKLLGDQARDLVRHVLLLAKYGHLQLENEAG